MTVYPSIVPLGPAESFLMRSSSCVQTDESSLETVTLGAVHVVAEGEGVDAEAVGLGDLDGAGELDSLASALASAEASAGSTFSCPLWAGPQALSARLAARHIPRARRRALEGVRARSIWWWCGAG